MFKTILCSALVLSAGVALAQDAGADREARRAEMQAQAKARFAAADADGNGRLDRVEAQALGERVATHFERIDANADGQLDPDELARAHHQARSGRHHGGERMAFQRGLIMGMDDDGDGSISRVELGTKAPKLLERFTAIDGNGDGELSPEEMRAHRASQRGVRGSPAPQ